ARSRLLRGDVAARRDGLGPPGTSRFRRKGEIAVPTPAAARYDATGEREGLMREGEDRHGAALRPPVERKLFLWLIAPIALITFVNSIDRVNVSYAGAAMSADLGLSPGQFGMGVSMFFVAYLLFQYP